MFGIRGFVLLECGASRATFHLKLKTLTKPYGPFLRVNLPEILSVRL